MSSHRVCSSGVGLGAKALSAECGAPKKLNLEALHLLAKHSINKRHRLHPVELTPIFLRHWLLCDQGGR